MIALLLEKPGAIAKWRGILGPGDPAVARGFTDRFGRRHRPRAPASVRARWGQTKQRNAAHGADSPEAARREICFVFGDGWSAPGGTGAAADPAVLIVHPSGQDGEQLQPEYPDWQGQWPSKPDVGTTFELEDARDFGPWWAPSGRLRGKLRRLADPRCEDGYAWSASEVGWLARKMLLRSSIVSGRIDWYRSLFSAAPSRSV